MTPPARLISPHGTPDTEPADCSTEEVHWQTLREAGLPDGAARGHVERLPDDDRIRHTVEILARTREPREPERVLTLLAWLAGGRHHWPAAFAELVGPAGRGLEHRLRVDLEATDDWDANRYLKLRRIAIENLSRVL